MVTHRGDDVRGHSKVDVVKDIDAASADVDESFLPRVVRELRFHRRRA
jgi:hypothetical protein